MKTMPCKHPRLDRRSNCKDCGKHVDLTVKRNKYGNRRTVVDGIKFDSAKEARRYVDLSSNPHVFGLELQKEYLLEVNGQLIAKYRADFAYAIVKSANLPSRTIVEDVKSEGTKTRVYAMKKKLMLACHKIEIQEV